MSKKDREERQKEREERQKKRRDTFKNLNPIKLYLMYNKLKKQTKIVLIITGAIVALVWFFAQGG